MSTAAVTGQRFMSEREPELGLGVVAAVDRTRITIDFPATGERRIYSSGTSVLKRVQFRAGESLVGRNSATIVIESVEEAAGLLSYVGQGARIREDEISDVTSVSQPQERLMAGQTDSCEVFDLRLRALEAQTRFRQSPVRGFLGGRLELLEHQFHIVQEMAGRQIPRALLADEVGLGKTIEACLIIQRLLAVGQARRVLILVPESLTHQWFVELLRRFNLWFSIFDEARCAASEQSGPGENPFLTSQLALAPISFLAGNEARSDQAVSAGWDMVVVDEAHHLAWTLESASSEYLVVERLAEQAPGLLLLTATPTQLGSAAHFARLRLLDPNRYRDFARFVEESNRFGEVAEIADKIVEGRALETEDQEALTRIFDRAPEQLERHLEALAARKPGAREQLIRTLVDQYGTGRVMFRNTRAAVAGFPKRVFCPAPLVDRNVTLLARVARELQAEETGGESGVRYSFKDDPRIEWLAEFLQTNRETKVLLICRSQRKVLAIESALQGRMAAKSALFYEGLPLVQRDRNAAWFAEPDGAQLLMCSEIGSEGRNFQFAHHLVMFDLPLNPGLVEQRIGRLDRIGQTQPIQIHVPYIAGSSDECVVEWYHRGLDAFEKPLHGGDEYRTSFKERLLEVALAYGHAGGEEKDRQLKPLVEETVEFRRKLNDQMARGRDRLLELASFGRKTSEKVIAEIREVETDPFLRRFLFSLLEHFGVQVKEHEGGDVFLDPSHAFIESFPSIPAEGMLATFDRTRATAREDLQFITADHPLVGDAIDLLIESKAGTTAFGTTVGDKPNLLLEAVFVLETVAQSRWHVDQFLSHTPVRVVVDVRGGDRTDRRDAASLAAEVEDGDLHRFLERPGVDVALVKRLVDAANGAALRRAEHVKGQAALRAKETLQRDLQRLQDLRRVNDHVREDEVALAAERLAQTTAAIQQARLRLDSLRLILEGPNVDA